MVLPDSLDFLILWILAIGRLEESIEIHWAIFDYSLSWFLSISPLVVWVHGWGAPMFHVSMLRKYIRDLEVKIKVDPIIIQQDLTIDS
jgi:hypothetical protein